MPALQPELQATLYLHIHTDDPHWHIPASSQIQYDCHTHIYQIPLCFKNAKAANNTAVNHLVPTIAASLPDTDTETPFVNFTHELHENEWRQHEFIPKNDLSCVQIELHSISMIWEHCRSLTENAHYVFSHTHVREKVASPRLNINFDELQQSLGCPQTGSLKISNQNEYIENGFALDTPVGIFYGITMGATVATLCYHAKNKTLDANAIQVIQEIAKQNHLIFVDWCKCEIPAE